MNLMHPSNAIIFVWIGASCLGFIVIVALVVLWRHSVQREVSKRKKLEEELFYSHDKTLELQKQLIKEERHIREEVEKRASIQYQQLVQASKLVTLGTLVSGIAHEINNPNNFIGFNNAVLQKIIPDLLPVLRDIKKNNSERELGGIPVGVVIEKLPQLTNAIDEGVGRIQKIVAQLKDFSREEPGDLDSDISLVETVKAAIGLLEHKISKKCHCFTTEFPESIPTIRGNAQKIEQVVVNLLDNALDALNSPQDRIVVGVDVDAKRCVAVVRIEDEGCGIAEENKEKVFDPFFTTKRDNGGTGLGLSISFSIIKEHGGVVHFEKGRGKGTRALVELPMDQSKLVEERGHEKEIS